MTREQEIDEQIKELEALKTRIEDIELIALEKFKFEIQVLRIKYMLAITALPKESGVIS